VNEFIEVTIDHFKQSATALTAALGGPAAAVMQGNA